MRKILSTLTLYSLIIFFIIGWWALAFRQPDGSSSLFPDIADRSIKNSNIALKTSLSNLNRDRLQQALSGDFALMSQLITDWDIDAQMLTAAGIQGVKRLPAHDFLRSHALIRLMHNATDTHSEQLSTGDFLIDDAGKRIDLTRSYHRFLPQTYAAAAFLLAIAPIDQIIALPRRMREQTQLYRKTVTDQIPLDIDRHNSEKLFQVRPEIAFVAHYSHPATIQTLANQGVVLFTMKNLKTIPDITDELMRIGQIINRPLQAELLKIFIEAAILAIDNRQLLLITELENIQKPLPTLLMINYHQYYSLPTQNTLTGQLLMRMGAFDMTSKYVSNHEHANEWMVPIDKERLINLNPDYLIIASDNQSALEKEIRNDNALKGLKAVRHARLYFVDEAVHHSPSQYIVLAYFDLLQVLTNHLGQ